MMVPHEPLTEGYVGRISGRILDFLLAPTLLRATGGRVPEVPGRYSQVGDTPELLLGLLSLEHIDRRLLSPRRPGKRTTSSPMCGSSGDERSISPIPRNPPLRINNGLITVTVPIGGRWVDATGASRSFSSVSFARMVTRPEENQ